MNVSQKKYGTILLFLTLINSVKVFFYGNKVIEVFVILVTFCLLLYLFLSSRLLGNMKVVISLALVGISMLITAVINGGWGSFFNYLILMLSSMMFSSYGCEKEQLKKIFVVSGFFSLFFLLSLSKKQNYNSYVFTTIFGYNINPNMVGMIALFSFYSLMYFCYEIRSLFLRVICISISSFICAYCMWLSECRSVLLAVVLFLLIFLLKKRPFKQITLRRIVLITQICSFLFVLIYLYLYSISYDIDLDIWGKSFFSGRQIVWNAVFEVVEQFPIVGSGGTIAIYSINGSQTVSAHNTVMSVLYVFGVIPAVFYYVFLGRKYDESSRCRQNRFCQSVVLSTLIITFVESFYMDSYLCFIFMLFFIPITVREKQKN